LSPANSSNSLPKPQLPDLLAGEVLGSVDAGVGPRHLERAGPLEDLADVRDASPCSREASAFGTQAMAKSAAPVASWVWGTMSTPPSTISTSRPSSS
jgi:hypothetical protein